VALLGDLNYSAQLVVAASYWNGDADINVRSGSDGSGIHVGYLKYDGRMCGKVLENRVVIKGDVYIKGSKLEFLHETGPTSAALAKTFTGFVGLLKGTTYSSLSESEEGV